MKAWIKFLILTSLAVLVALAFQYYSGSVVVFLYPDTKYTTSLSFALAFVFLSFVSLYVLLRLVIWFLNVPGGVGAWRRRRRDQKQQNQLEQGWISLLQGRYAHAAHHLSDVSEDMEDVGRKLVALLSAVKAALLLQDYAQCERLLSEAKALREQAPKFVPALAIVGAEVALAQKDYERALSALEPLLKDKNELFYAHRLALSVYQGLGQWQEVLNSVHYLLKASALDQERADELRHDATMALLQQAQDAKQRKKTWKSLPSKARVQAMTAIEAARIFSHAYEWDVATSIIEEALDHQLSASLLENYSKNIPDDWVPARLKYLERRLDEYPSNADVLMALATLCMQNQLWGKATHYIDKAIALHPNARAYALRATLKEQLQQNAHDDWRDAAQLALFVEPISVANTPNEVLNSESLSTH